MSAALFDVTERVALITGSSRGIGYALARGLLRAGANVVINGRDEAALARARTQLAEQTGRTPHVESFDVTSADAVAAGMSRIEDAVGPLEILVNNAGAQHRAPITEFALEDWTRLLTLNLTSAFLAGREAARHMSARGHGKIINICSVQSETVRPGIAPYSATKGGLKQLTKGMCADLGPHGIQVNGLGPGYFDTELTSALVSDAEFSRWVAKRTPAGRWGQVEDLVGALIFLSSPASDFVNGHTLFVDGGMVSVV